MVSILATVKGKNKLKNYIRNDFLMQKGLTLPTFTKTGTTIVGLVFKVLKIFIIF